MSTRVSDDWRTPKSLFDELRQEFDFTIDAAASAENALLPRYWDIETDAMQQDWAGERIWCNPPYGKHQIAFIAKAAERQADVAVLLVPARTDSKVWHEYVFPNAEIRFLKGRLCFGPTYGRAPFPSALLIFRSPAG